MKKYAIAIDAFGGDHAPKSVLKGLHLYCSQNKEEIKDVTFKLYGDAAKLKKLLPKYKEVMEHSEIIDIKGVVSNSAKPSKVIRKSQDTSMWQAVKAVKDGNADAVLSAGNTGCYMAFAKLQLRTLDGLKRPALTAILPTSKTSSVTMLDLGANSECSATSLKEFAQIGTIHHKILNPHKRSIRVGLLNIGEEEGKGISLIQDAHEMLQLQKSKMFDYKGFIEGNDIMKGNVDVIVADGFTGNVALKTIEGAVLFVKHLLTNVFKSSLLTKLAYLMIKSKLKRFAKKIDPNNYNGAVLAGVNGIVVKSHGGAKHKGYANAISNTVSLTKNNFNKKIKEIIKKR